MAHIRIDKSDRTFLPICLDCGWRGDIEPNQIAALTAGARHERRAHVGEKHVSNYLAVTRRRARS